MSLKELDRAASKLDAVNGNVNSTFPCSVVFVAVNCDADSAETIENAHNTWPNMHHAWLDTKGINALKIKVSEEMGKDGYMTY